MNEHEKAYGANWRRWLGHLKDKPAVVGMELGTWKGESAEWFLDNILTAPDSFLICVDTFEGSPEHRLAGIDCSGNEAEARTRLDRFGRTRIVKGKTHEVLQHELTAYPQAELAFLYVDADHSAMNVMRDSVLGFDLLKVGGVMIWDDYQWEVMRDEIDRPRLAIDSFLACYARRLEVLGMGWQVAVRKTA